MLQAIRSRASGFVIKILFGLLIVSFGLWGIGDIFRNGSSADTTVAKVGDTSVNADQLNRAVRADMVQLRSVLGSNVDLDQAKQLGIVDTALQTLINDDLVDQEVDRLGLVVGDEAVRQAILANPNFRNSAGNFDRSVYTQLLASNQMTEPQFEASLRHDLVRNQLTNAITIGVTPPKILVDTLYRSRAEKRVADLVTIPASAAPAIPAPTDAQLAAFHDAHPDLFRVPELRNVTLALLRLDDVAATIKIPDDTLKQEYQSRLNDFRTPEERQIQQILLPDEAKAKAAKAAIDAGKDFAAVAKEMANQDPASTDLGWMKQGDLPKEIGDAAFGLKQGAVSDPVKSSFGWHVLRVNGIKPEVTQSFEAVKSTLSLQLARDQAGDAIAKTANSIDDALAGGASMADVAQKFGLKTVTVSGVDAEGKGADGKPVDLPQPAAPILHAAFATDSGQTSELTELGDIGYFILRTDKVVPATVKPLSETHDQTLAAWQAEQRSQALGKLADGITAEVGPGKSLKDIAAAHKLTVTTSPAFERSGGTEQVPPALVAKLFDAKPGTAVNAPAGDAYIVAEVTSVTPADPAKDSAAVNELSTQLGGDMQNDASASFDQTLRAHFPVEVNKTNLDRAL